MARIEFPVSDRTINAYLALPEQGEGPGVLVLHAWWGLTPVFTDVCDRLAAAGFVALAPDLYEGKTTAAVEQAEQLVQAMDGETTYATVNAALEQLRSHPAVRSERVGIVGFSMGAAWALMMEGAIAAIVVFYGTTDPQYIGVEAAFQGHFAEDDAFEPLDNVRGLEASLRAAGRDVVFYTYPATHHWFVEPNRPEYDAEAADLAWGRTLDFLRAHLQVR